MTKRRQETGKHDGGNETAILPSAHSTVAQGGEQSRTASSSRLPQGGSGSGQAGRNPSDIPERRQTPDGPKPSPAIPDPGKPLVAQDPVVLLAMCLFGEARGESDTARRAVAQVVLNRARHPHPVFGSRAGAAWEDNLRRVILRPAQFSALHPSDLNFAKLLRPLEAEDAAVWERCLRCAEEALAARDGEDRLTANSDHYFDDSIRPPSWADPAKRTVKLGRLNFYRLYLPPPGNAMQIAVPPLPAGSGPGAESTEPLCALPPAPSRFQPAARNAIDMAFRPTQEPPAAEPSSADSPSTAHAADGRPSPATPLIPARRDGTSHATSLPERVPQCAWIPRLSKLERALRAGRLSSLCPGLGTRASGLGNPEFRIPNPESRNDIHVSVRPSRESRLRLALLAFCLLLAGCNDFERAGYRTLAVTQAEYETIQRHVAEAAAHGLITEEQWNRFRVEGHRFIDAHNAAVDAFELWSRVKSQPNEARVMAILEILPRLVRQLNTLAESFEEQQKPEARSQESVEKQDPRGFPRLRSGQGAPRDDRFVVLFWLLNSEF